MNDDNIFDEDDALDYIIYEEHEKTESKKNNGGCLTILLFFLVPVGSIFFLVNQL